MRSLSVAGKVRSSAVTSYSTTVSGSFPAGARLGNNTKVRQATQQALAEITVRGFLRFIWTVSGLASWLNQFDTCFIKALLYGCMASVMVSQIRQQMQAPLSCAMVSHINL